MTLPFILVVVERSPLNRDTCSSCHFSVSFPTFGGDLEQDIFEFVLHLLTIRLRAVVATAGVLFLVTCPKLTATSSRVKPEARSR